MAGLAVTGLAAMVGPGTVSAQDAGSDETLNVFFDCQAPGCNDEDFFRREIPIINWVRDREVADLHVLVTSQSTGGGGRLYTLAFLGLDELEGQDGALTATTGGDATSDEQRRTVVERMKLGLVQYLAGTPAADQLSVVVEGAGQQPGDQPGETVSPQSDPWDFWVFRINANGFINGESTSKFANYNSSIEASRTTEAWKLSVSARFSEDVQEFKIPDEDDPDVIETIREETSDWGFNGLLVRSVGPQWSVGMRASAASSTFLNQDYRWEVKPGLEYNIFPYAESDRRSLTLQYLVGPVHYNYRERTIFDETSETRMQQSLSAGLSLVQPWGRWSTRVDGAQYLHDRSKYNVRVSGSVNVRLFRGFSVRINGNYSWIRDQLNISAAGATDAQVLLRRRQLETSYRYFTSFGFEYRFGSIFNNVVNPRFGPDFFFF